MTSSWLSKLLKDTDVIVSTVIGFPHGSNLTAIKVAEAQAAMDDGALELDMVLNIGELRSGKQTMSARISRQSVMLPMPEVRR